jgi:hypothetical protein
MRCVRDVRKRTDLENDAPAPGNGCWHELQRRVRGCLPVNIGVPRTGIRMTTLSTLSRFLLTSR